MTTALASCAEHELALGPPPGDSELAEILPFLAPTHALRRRAARAAGKPSLREDGALDPSETLAQVIVSHHSESLSFSRSREEVSTGTSLYVLREAETITSPGRWALARARRRQRGETELRNDNVLRALRDRPFGLTVERIIAEVRGAGFKTSRATVYRSLEALGDQVYSTGPGKRGGRVWHARAGDEGKRGYE